MKLTAEQVKKVAKLANLPVTEKEVETYSAQLFKILEYIEQLNQVDTTKVEPVYNVSPNQNVLARDHAESSLPQDAALQNGANVRDGYFVTKGVFKEE